MEKLRATSSFLNKTSRAFAALFSFFISPMLFAQQALPITLATPELSILEEPSSCSMAIDRTKRVYQLSIAGLDDDDIIRFRTKGPKGRSKKIKVSKLLSGEIKLPTMSVTGQFADLQKQRGLWAVHDDSGQEVQLSYLPGYRACNSKGLVIISYRNVWVRTTRQAP